MYLLKDNLCLTKNIPLLTAESFVISHGITRLGLSLFSHRQKVKDVLHNGPHGCGTKSTERKNNVVIVSQRQSTAAKTKQLGVGLQHKDTLSSRYVVGAGALI